MRGPGQSGLALSLGIAVTVMWVVYGRLVKQPVSGAGVRGAPHLYGAPGYDGLPRRLTALFRSRGRAGAFARDPGYRPALCWARTGCARFTHVPGRRDGGAPQPAYLRLLCRTFAGRRRDMQGAGRGPAPLSGSSPHSKDGAQRSVALPCPARQRRMGPPGAGGVPAAGAGRAEPASGRTGGPGGGGRWGTRRPVLRRRGGGKRGRRGSAGLRRLRGPRGRGGTGLRRGSPGFGRHRHQPAAVPRGLRGRGGQRRGEEGRRGGREGGKEGGGRGAARPGARVPARQHPRSAPAGGTPPARAAPARAAGHTYRAAPHKGRAPPPGARRGWRRRRWWRWRGAPREQCAAGGCRPPSSASAPRGPSPRTRLAAGVSSPPPPPLSSSRGSFVGKGGPRWQQKEGEERAPRYREGGKERGRDRWQQLCISPEERCSEVFRPPVLGDRWGKALRGERGWAAAVGTGGRALERSRKRGCQRPPLLGAAGTGPAVLLLLPPPAAPGC